MAGAGIPLPLFKLLCRNNLGYPRTVSPQVSAHSTFTNLCIAIEYGPISQFIVARSSLSHAKVSPRTRLP
jgi:hypothetical protein